MKIKFEAHSFVAENLIFILDICYAAYNIQTVDTQMIPLEIYLDS